MNEDTYVEALQSMHRELEQALEQENECLWPDSTVTQSLKRRKLKIKDELARLNSG